MPAAQTLRLPLAVLQGHVDRGAGKGGRPRAPRPSGLGCLKWAASNDIPEKTRQEASRTRRRTAARTDRRPQRTQLPVFLAVGPSGPAAHVSENSSCHPVLPSDASDEQNAQSPAENSMNSAEKVERQPPGDAGPGAETSSVAQVPRSRSQRGSQSGREPAGVSGVRGEVFRYFVLSCSHGTIGTSGCVLPCPAPALDEALPGPPAAAGRGRPPRPSLSFVTLLICVHRSAARSQRPRASFLQSWADTVSLLGAA